MSAPIMPVQMLANPGSVQDKYSFGVFLRRGAATPDDVPVVVVPIDRASWDAMVERASIVYYARYHDHSITEGRSDVAAAARYDVKVTLRAALNLPEGWTP